MREVRCKDTASDAEGFSCHSGKETVHVPAADEMIGESADIAAESFAFPKWELVNTLSGEYMGPIEIRQTSLVAPITRVGWCARIGCGQAAARGRSHRIDGLLIDRLRERVRSAKQQACFEPF